MTMNTCNWKILDWIQKQWNSTIMAIPGMKLHNLKKHVTIKTTRF
jgi:hypothetical protein